MMTRRGFGKHNLTQLRAIFSRYKKRGLRPTSETYLNRLAVANTIRALPRRTKAEIANVPADSFARRVMRMRDDLAVDRHEWKKLRKQRSSDRRIY